MKKYSKRHRNRVKDSLKLTIELAMEFRKNTVRGLGEKDVQ